MSTHASIRINVQPDPVDWAALVESWRKAWIEAGETLTRSINGMFRTLRGITRVLRESANSTVNVAGLSARYYVRAGLDPAYRTPEALDALVGSIMGGHEDELLFLTLESRSLVAAAAIASWDDSYGTGTPVIAWHRLMGATTVTVGHAA